MREIKFRAWDEQQKRFLRPSEIFSRLLIDDETGKVFIGGIMGKDWHEPILTQFTGLFDKNGKEIYEGDIVKGNYLKDIGVVKWNDKFAKFNISDKMNITPSDEFEVVGNIYENSELLKDEE